MTIVSFKTLLLLLVLCQFVVAQPPASQPKQTPTQKPASQNEDEVGEGDVLRVTANLVSVPVVVRNRHGQYVIDLQQREFRIFEDGVEQAIAHFSNVDQPFSVVLLIDTSGSAAPFLNQIKSAAKAFVEQLRPSDKVRPIYFHGEIKSLTNTGTNDHELLKIALDQMQSGPEELGTRMFDAVDFSMNALRPEQTRKAVILFTDGENTWGKATMKSTLEEAEESDVIFYTLQYGDLPQQKYLQDLAFKTGGRYFKAADVNSITQAFAGVAEELRRQYLIGYYPTESRRSGQVKAIKVRVARKNVAVKARESYTYGRP
jgi:Ca-activated chloride channel homolog